MTPTTAHSAPTVADLYRFSPTKDPAQQDIGCGGADGATHLVLPSTPSVTLQTTKGSRCATLARAGVWCEALVTVKDGTGAGQQVEQRWDAYAAPSPCEAIRWMRSSVQTVTPTLGRLQRGYVLDHWVHGPASLEDFARLDRGRSCWLTVYRDGAEIAWRARAVRFLPAAAVSGRPSCACPRQCVRMEVFHAR
ncbi:hypothetical protein ACGRHY_27335 [Streptomyces sp. HK10]|uniref:hypothetical protein n=1 Tax=Streptomyces sp. HK10 TaxID=3373255 RepID=UPI003749D079